VHYFIVAITNDSYMFRLESGHRQAMYIRCIKHSFLLCFWYMAWWWLFCGRNM